VPATIVLSRRAFEVAELVTPIAGCGGQADPECSNGVDDDDDGVADARSFGADPDPGCSSPADTSEDSEVALPGSCAVRGGDLDGDEFFPGVEVSGCQITGVWFKPSAMPSECVYVIGGTARACDVTGATAGATFPATGGPVVLGARTQTVPSCEPVTIAVTLADGRVGALRAPWC
jgi:hypothetical protein